MSSQKRYAGAYHRQRYIPQSRELTSIKVWRYNFMTKYQVQVLGTNVATSRRTHNLMHLDASSISILSIFPPFTINTQIQSGR